MSGEVGNTNGLGLARLNELLHGTVGDGEVTVDLSIEIAGTVRVTREERALSWGQSNWPANRCMSTP